MPVVTKNHAVLMMHKCATSFVRWVLLAAYPEAEQLYRVRHTPFYQTDPSSIAGRQIVGLRRNPWEWYVSFWNYDCKEGYYQPRWDKPPTFQEWMDAYLLKHQSDPFYDMPPNPNLCVGRYTFVQATMHLKDPESVRSQSCRDAVMDAYESDLVCQSWVDTATLTEDMQRIFYPGIVDHFKNKKRNSYKHDHYREYYTPELRDAVMELDLIPIRHFGYSF